MPNFNNNAKDAKNNAQDSADDFKAAGRDAVKETKNNLSNFNDFAHKAGRQVRSFIDNAGDRISDASSNVSKQVKEHPARTGLVALGLGAAVVAILRLRRR